MAGESVMVWHHFVLGRSFTGDFAPTVPFGTHLVLDIQGCHVESIESRDRLHSWVTGLVHHIGMKAYGEPRIEHFGHDDPVTAGYTVDQLIETSNIMGHFSPYLGTAYIDIFSCRPFDPQSAADFTAQRLGGTTGRMIVIDR